MPLTMFNNPRMAPLGAMQLRIITQTLVCFGLVLGFIVFLAAAVTVPQAGAAVTLGDRTPVAQRKLLASATKTPTLTPTRKLTSAIRAPSAPLSPQTIPGQTQVDGNTVLLYHFDSPAGNSVIDATGNYTGTLFGSATITTSGLYSGALKVDGNASYVRVGNLGNMSQGTIEAFVDFYTACTFPSANDLPIVTAGGEYGSGGTVIYLGVETGLKFGIYANGAWNWVDSGINACRYLTGMSGNPFPYDPVTFHHVAATWGPRGMEIWVDGVLHGVGNNVAQLEPYPYMCNPQMQWGTGGSPPNPDAPYTCPTPKMYPTMPAFPPGDYRGGLPTYTTFLIGCESGGSCINGRIDEVRISNIQRTFTLAVVPTPTPIPTQTPVYISGEYAVDSNTEALYHLNFETSGSVLDEVTQQNKGLHGQAVVVPNGRFSSGLALDGNGSYLAMGNPGSFGAGAVEAWVNFGSWSTNQVLLNASRVFWFGGTQLVLSLQTNPQTGNLRLNILVSDGQSSQTVDSGVPVSGLLGCWHHIAGTWGGRGLEMWIDGVLRNVNSGYTGGMYSLVDDWHVGCDFSGNCMKGIIDELRVSKIQRTYTSLAYSPMRAFRSSVQSSNQAASSDGILTFLPMLQVAPTPACPFGP